MIIDFHTHTFPDKIAARAIAQLEQASHSRAFTNGTVEGLKASMRKAGIDASVVMPVAIPSTRAQTLTTPATSGS